MSGFLALSREFINSSLWNDFTLIEKGLLVEMLRITPMRAKEYNLYGSIVQLEAYELCFSVKRMAKFLGVTYHCLRMFLTKLETLKLIRKQTRRLNFGENTQSIAQSKTRSKNYSSKITVYTSVTFCASVFVDIWNTSGGTAPASAENEASHEVSDEHNLNNNIYREEEGIKENTKVLKTDIQESAVTLTNDNPKILLSEWQKRAEVTSEEWHSQLAEYIGTDIGKIRKMLKKFVTQQLCQGYYFLMLREFQRRFVIFAETRINKRKFKTIVTNGTETFKPAVISEAVEKSKSEQVERIDNFAAELFGTGGSGSGGDDA